ncbi:MAG: penicillin-binding protein 1C [Pseudomonadales bacterium]|nr:penicillin-binding protein 1C [Pseudomonadales bacterium]
MHGSPEASGTLRLCQRDRRVAIAAGCGLAIAVASFWFCLPQPLFDAPTAHVLTARNGELLGARIATDGQWRFPPLTRVPDRFGTAAIHYEDKRFLHHIGIDPLAIARAVRLNLQQGRIASGGSTLTMQVARLALRHEKRSITAKLAEVMLALRIEAGYDKSQILALYANNAPFGGNVVGLESAAWRYFNRPPEELSWAEACTLAVLPNSPSLVHLQRNRARLASKRNALLGRLFERSVIDQQTLALALAEPLTAEPRELPDIAPHLLETLRSETPQVHRYASTLDARLQATATEVLSEYSKALARQQIYNAAALVVDNRTFEVLAYVGNSQWSASGDRGYAVDIVRRPRSTGSILKPYLYAAMLEDGALLPQMLVADIPTSYGGYTPENFDREYRGAVPADVALAQSLNVPAVRMLRRYGVERFYDVLRDAGMSTLRRPAADYGLTLILGGAEATLWDTTAMYANLADIARRAAEHVDAPYQRLRVLTENPVAAPKLPAHPEIGASATRVGPGAAWLTLNALAEVTRPGEEGHWRNFASAHKLAWKTGTSWGLRDGWAIGTNDRYTVGVWVGNATGEGRPGLTGSSVAAPLMFALVARLEHGAWFAQPYYAMRQVDVCRNDGYLANDQCDSKRIWIPRGSHFDQQTPFNLPVHLDAAGLWRVDSGCESPQNMQHRSWFALPPLQEAYYRRTHTAYRALPEYRPDCMANRAVVGVGPLDLVYPNDNATIFIPLELDGRIGRTVFEAVHRRADALLYWHLDDQYLASTRGRHQLSLNLNAGAHVITVVDDEGNRVARRFTILARPGTHTAAR